MTTFNRIADESHIWSPSISGDARDIVSWDNGTLVGGATIDTLDTDNGGSGAFDLDGVAGTYVDTDVTDMSGTGWTVMAWVKLTTAGSFPMIVSKDDDAFDLRFSGTSRKPNVLVGSGGSSATILSGTAIALDTWTHLAFVLKDNGDLELYVNGVIDPVTDTGGSIGSNANNITIGRRPVGTEYNFDGLIDEVRIAPSAWSPSQIAEAASRRGYRNLGTPFGGEVGAWSPTLTGDSTDWIGANDGTPTGGVTVIRDRSAGGLQAWDLDGSTGYIALNSAPLTDTATDFTLSGWIKTSATTHQALYGQYNSSSQQALGWSVKTDGLLSIDSWPPSAGEFKSLNVVNTGDWVHIAYTRSGNDQAMYINGVLDNSSSSAETYTGGATTDWWIGAQYTGSVIRGFLGTIDGFRIFNRALEPSEIKELSTKAGYQRSAQSFSPTGKWSPSQDKFGAASGDAVAHDLSGGGDPIVLSAGSVYVNDSADGGRKAIDCNAFAGPITGANVKTQEFTDCMWVKWEAALFNEGIYHMGTFVSEGRGMYGTSGGDLRWYVQGTVVTIAASLSTDQWYHIACRRDADGAMEVFLDGVSAVTGTKTGTITYGGTFEIGRADPSYTFYGLLDTFESYDRALTDDEIKFKSGSRTAEKPYTLPGCVGHWAPTLDPRSVTDVDGPLDLTFGGNNGTLTGNATYDVADTGKSGSAAFSLDGTGDYISVPDSDDFSIRTTEYFTISGWLYRTGNNYECLMSKTSGGSEWQLTVTNNGSLAFSTANVGGPTVHSVGTGNGKIPSLQWNHIAITVDNISGDYLAYINGVLASSALGGNLVTTTGGTSPVWIGATSSVIYDTTGFIDNVQIYNRVLNAVEVEQLYNSERPGQPVAYNKLFGQGRNNEDVALYEHWDLQETTGTTAASSAALGTALTTTTGAALSSVTGPTSYFPNAVDLEATGVALWQGYATETTSMIALSDDAEYTMFSRAYTDALDSSTGHLWGFGRLNLGSNLLRQFMSFASIRSRHGNGNLNFDINKPDAVAWCHTAAINGKTERALIVDGTRFDGTVSTDDPLNINNLDQMILGAQPTNVNPPPLATHLTVADVALLIRVATEAEVAEHSSGPEPIYIGDTLPFFKSTPTEDVALFVNPGTWGLDPSFGAGTNGLLTWHYDWYIMDDDTGTNKAYLETTTEPEGYTPVSADVGKFLQVKVTGVNDGGIDTSEEWWTLPAEVQSGGPPASFEPAWAVSQKQVQS